MRWGVLSNSPAIINKGDRKEAGEDASMCNEKHESSSKPFLSAAAMVLYIIMESSLSPSANEQIYC